MQTNLKKAKVDGRVTTVMKPDEVLKNPSMQNKYTSVEVKDYILPVKSAYDPSSPGFYIMNNGKLGKIIYPSDNDKEEYLNKDVIDFSDVKTMRELIAKQEEVKRMEADVLSNSDNLFKPIAKENDSPEMKAMKRALCKKNIDLDAYADRFGDNYNNDKRLLKGSSITMSKLKSICDKLDMKCTLTISDASPNIPNPIGEDIVVDICGGFDDGDEE